MTVANHDTINLVQNSSSRATNTAIVTPVIVTPGVPNSVPVGTARPVTTPASASVPATATAPPSASVSKSTASSANTSKPNGPANSATGSPSGHTFGEYEIYELLGAGGNGQVFRARHRWLDIPVAIKFLLGVDANDQTVSERFRREAMVAARMIHPNIVRATDGGIAGQRIFLVTDLVVGKSLTAIVQQHGPLTLPEVAAVAVGVSKGLRHIALNATVHRDIKPSNIMVDETGEVRILDLGLARSQHQSHTLTETGQVMGTVDFMSPEQAQDPRNVDYRADLYSLGCTLYFLSTGRAPFQSDDNDSIAAKLLAHMEKEVTPISAYRLDIPKPICQLIEQMLAKSPSDRPTHYELIINRFEPLSTGNRLAEKVRDSSNHATPATPDRSSIISTATYSDKFRDWAINTALCLLGFQETIPGRRPGQKPAYQTSFKWIRNLFTLLVLLGIFWFIASHIQFVEYTEIE